MPRFSLRRLASSRRTRIILGIAGALLLVYLLMDQLVMPLYTRQGRERPIPRLIGLSREQARAVAESVGFEIVEAAPKLGNSEPEGTVLEQRPAPGALSKAGRKIHVVPAMGVTQGSAPDVVGLELRDAQLRARNVGLISGDSDVSYRWSDRVPKGQVIAQEPAAGKKTEPGSVMRLTVSMGTRPEHFYAPYLMEKTLSEARSTLRESGLRLGRITRKETGQYPPGTVIAQSIRSGEEVEPNAAIDIVVAIKPGVRTDTTDTSTSAPPETRPTTP